MVVAHWPHASKEAVGEDSEANEPGKLGERNVMGMRRAEWSCGWPPTNALVGAGGRDSTVAIAPPDLRPCAPLAHERATGAGGGSTPPISCAPPLEFAGWSGGGQRDSGGQGAPPEERRGPDGAREGRFDPVRRARELEDVVCRGEQRRYYRFRPARWYGGISTGDVCGCNLLCLFCWAGDDIRSSPGEFGALHTPASAFRNLDRIARRKGYRLLRLSGQEPTIGREHLLGLLSLTEDAGYDFILETNGILIGAEGDYAPSLARFRHLEVRVSLKGTCEEEFSALTGAGPSGFTLQLRALENLVASGVRCHPAVMVSFSSPENLRRLVARLGGIDSSLARGVEVEELILYPHVVRRLKSAGLGWREAHQPERVPERLV